MEIKETTIGRARAGDEEAFRELTDPYRRELQLHCYRILGSIQDAEDLLQETFLAAWRGLEGFEGRSSLRSWLYRIATHRCPNPPAAATRAGWSPVRTPCSSFRTTRRVRRRAMSGGSRSPWRSSPPCSI